MLAGEQIYALWDLPGALIGGFLFSLVMFAILAERPKGSYEDVYAREM